MKIIKRGWKKLETIEQECKRLGITKSVYYKLAHRLGHRPTEQDVKEHKAKAKAGRPRKSF